MPFIYKGGAMPSNKALIKKVNSAAQRVYEKLTEAGLSAPVMDEHYRKRFYKAHLRKLRRKLRDCTYHILWAIDEVPKPMEQVTLIDHGGGLGFIGLVAKEAGIGTVLYNDIDHRFLEAARGIAQVAGVELDRYILGDVDVLIHELEKTNTSLDALVSYDVIEHIYNLDDFFSRLYSSACCPQVIFASSGANMFNPYCLCRVLPVQAEREFLNRCKRVNIIRECAPDMREKDIVLISKKTRLLTRKEIETVVLRYLDGNKIEIPRKEGANKYDPYGSNTVDPETGWWAEHLVNPYYLTHALEKKGFWAKITAGFYGDVRGLLNPIIKVLGAPLALPIAGYYTVYARNTCSHRDVYGC